MQEVEIKAIEVDGNLILLNDVLSVTKLTFETGSKNGRFDVIYKTRKSIYFHQGSGVMKDLGEAVYCGCTEPLEEVREKIIQILNQ